MLGSGVMALSIRRGKAAGLCWRAAMALLLALLATSYCFAADVVFIRSSGTPDIEQQKLEIATNFYGVNLKVVTAASATDTASLRAAIGSPQTVGVVIAADALTVVNKDALLAALQHGRGEARGMLIVGVSSASDRTVLRSWSGGAVIGSSGLGSPRHPQYVFGRLDGVTGQLANLAIPVPLEDGYDLVAGQDGAAQPILSLKHDDQVSPVFVAATVGPRRVFLASALASTEALTSGEGVVRAFLRVAPEMIFVRYCAGDRGWQAPGHYANFTIDDPWLRQPYGYVDYPGLLREMDKHNFHTTIAFIPWNYDRNQAAVVSLFRDHPERFSIAVHGDNHDHQEFTDYRSKPLGEQIDALKQSLARMEKFRELTGIPYDKVMIFPHSIAPQKTLAALKTYNYLATINSTNVPQDATEPRALSFELRPVTLSFGSFPSITRYSVEVPIPSDFIAINEFLDNPLLFYAHSDLFAGGIEAFDPLADEVNKREPDTRWRPLGDIVRHLYVVKRREDSDYDLLAFSSDICVANASERDSVYYVRKQESGDPAIASVSIDGQPQAYGQKDGYLQFAASVPRGATRCMAIQYRNDLALASIDISKRSFAVYFLRMASDFRDDDLSKSAWGLDIVRFYNQHHVKPVEFLGCVLVLLMALLYAVYRLQAAVARRLRSGKGQQCLLAG
jgi:hypothetical protein